MDAIDELSQLSDSMIQAAAVLADDDIDDVTTSKRTATFLNVVALGNVGAGKSAILNSLIGHPVLPTGENGATRAPISIDLQRDNSLNNKLIVLQIDNKSQQVSASALRHSLQDRLSKGTGVHSSGRSQADEIYMKLRTSTAPPLKLIDLPGLDQRAMDESMISDYAARNDAILLVIVPAAQSLEISSSRALKLAKEFDSEGTRTIGVISKIDQAAGDQKTLAAVQALLSDKGPRLASDVPWVALIGQSVSIASAQAGSVGSDNSLETAWRAESESLRSILTGASPSKLGRVALVDTIAKQIRNRMKVRLPNLLSGLQGKSQMVADELVRLGEQMVHSAEGTRAIALELCREFEDKFLQHISSGEGGGWKVVSSFEGNFPNRIKQLPLDKHFDINNVKRIVLEADGYQPYLISPEKGLRSLIKGVLELAKEPSRLCVDEVHRVLIDIVSAAANATSGLGRYPPFKREVIAIASAALDGFRNEAKKMVVALVDMERAFVPSQHFIRLVQRRMDRQRREEEIKNRSSKKGNEAEQSILNRATSPQTGLQQPGGSLKSMKEKSTDKDVKEGSALQTAGPSGEITAGFLLKKSAKSNSWSRRWFVLNEKSGKLGYTKKQEERHFRGVIALEECNTEELLDEEEPKSSKDSKKSTGSESGKGPSLVFKITSKVPYKTVMKAHSAVVLKAENMADKTEWVNKIRNITQPANGISGKGTSVSEAGPAIRQSLSDGSLDTMTRRPADPEEELRWMSQEVRGYVEAVLNSLAANAVVLCQVEKAKEDMLNQLYSSVSAHSASRIEELLLEDQNVKRKRERAQKQSSLLSKLTHQLGIHDNRAAAASWSNGGNGEASPRTSARSGDDWRSAFDAAANGPTDFSRSFGDSRANSVTGHSRRYSDPAQNGDGNSGSNSGSRRTPNRLPPPPPPQGASSSMYKY
ncbi:putative dynamin GTPase [Dioscorea sansibarensis]